MFLLSTGIGGFFSIIFGLLAIILISNELINYSMDNVLETRALVPLVTLENEVYEFPANVYITSTFYRYGGECNITEIDCHNSINYYLTYIKYESISIKCQKYQNETDCHITLELGNCIISTGASLNLNLKEQKSYTSAISVNVTSQSSIPGEMSTIDQTLIPESSTVLRGFEPSKFSLTMTPTYFRSYVSDYPSKLTGYHVSIESTPQAGSSYKITQLPFTSNLNLQINLYKSDTALHVTRTAKSNVLTLLSALLGSVFGMMSAIGGIMKLTEKQFKRIKEFLKNKQNKGNIRNNGKTYKKMMTNREEDPETDTKIPKPLIVDTNSNVIAKV